MKCSNRDCDRGLGLVQYRRGWFSKRRYCSRRCRDGFVARLPKHVQRDWNATTYFEWLFQRPIEKNQPKPIPAVIRRASKGSLLLVLLAAFFCTTIAHAQDYRGTSEQRLSCTPDAFRLCASYIPDGAQVENCLRQNMPNLSEACRSVFDQSARSPVSLNK